MSFISHPNHLFAPYRNYFSSCLGFLKRNNVGVMMVLIQESRICILRSGILPSSDTWPYDLGAASHLASEPV